MDEKIAAADVGAMEKGSESDIKVGDLIEVHATPEEEAKVLAKIDRFILPLMGVCQMLQYMDKVTLGFTTQLGLTKDLHLHGKEYSWASSVFYFGYLFWSWPSSYIAVRFPLAKYLAVTVAVWGVVLMCHGATTDYKGLVVARFFLGVSESAVAPGFSLLTGMFYKRKEQPSRMCVWFIGNGVANLVAGLIAYGIGQISGSLAPWRYLFIILGAITVLWGIVLFFLLPDSPSKARFLNAEEKAVALHRTIENKTGIMDENTYKVQQSFEALKDPQAWLLALFMFSVNIANGGTTSFNSIIIHDFGFSPLNSLLLQMPNGLFQLGGLAFVSICSTYLRNTRLFCMALMILFGLIGMIMVLSLPSEQKFARLGGLWLSAMWAVDIPMALALIASNVGGFSKRATVNGMMFIGYCAGNIVGPQLFFASQAPRYPTGIKGLLSGFALGVFFLCLLWVYYRVENSRRDRKYGAANAIPQDEELEEDLSNKTDREISHFRYVR
ncbi:hypothetical protein LTR27_012760 [Elasticomyces elasticus]|nr:hypothetical protein LTR27_012760 [Elasticomyces elasticus]